MITGMRVAPGGAQEHYLVTPDITVISKAVGGGYPVGAFGASAEIMDVIVRGPMFHGGVFSGNAMVMSAAEAVLDVRAGQPRRDVRPSEQDRRSIGRGHGRDPDPAGRAASGASLRVRCWP